jgi:hypothetical protein
VQQVQVSPELEDTPRAEAVKDTAVLEVAVLSALKEPEEVQRAVRVDWHLEIEH